MGFLGGFLNQPGLSGIVSLGPNLLRNPQVEEGTGSPTGWTNTPKAAYWSGAQHYSGKRSLNLMVNNATGGWRADPVPVQPGKWYHVGMQVVGTGSPECFLVLRWLSKGKTVATGYLAIDKTYTGWTRVALEDVAPEEADAVGVSFECISKTKANLYGDDFVLRKIR